MMTKGITEGSLPENVIGEGKAIDKERFLTVAAFFAVTNVIKGIFNQLGRGLTNLGGKLGGDTGRSIGSAPTSKPSIPYLPSLKSFTQAWHNKKSGTLQEALYRVIEIPYSV